MIRGVLGSRASIGGVLGSGRGGTAAAAEWYLAGGVSAANAIAAYQPKGAASLAASYTNLANPGTYNAAPGTAPSFDTATGWTFAAASSQYLTTGITPANDQTWSLIIRFSNAASAYGFLAGCGASGAGPLFGIQPNRPNNTLLYANGNYIFPTPSLSSGVVAIAGNKGYRNGSVDTGTIASIAGSLSPLYIGGSKYADGATIFYYSSIIQAIAIYSVTLTAPQVAAISAAMAAL